MPQLTLSDDECQRVITAMSYAPWRECNDLILKIAQQMRSAQIKGEIHASGRGNADHVNSGTAGSVARVESRNNTRVD